MKLALGTVQFGLDYGVSNNSGRTSLEEARKILSVARTHGISVVDTAPAYGESEAILGLSLPDDTTFKVVSKTPVLSAQSSHADYALLINNSFKCSLQALRRKSIYGLLVHHADDLLQKEGKILWSALSSLKKEGLVAKVGVSVYSGEQIDQVLDLYAIDLIQLPVNVLDQRLIRSGHLARLKTRGVEIHARSAFLQGLLLMDPGALPPYFAPFQSKLEKYHTAINKCGMTPVQAALAFVVNIPEIDNVICGVNNHQQLQELCNALGLSLPMDFQAFSCDDTALVNPSRWNITA